MIAGTRILPVGGTCQTVSDRRSNRESSMSGLLSLELDVHDALGPPLARADFTGRQLGHGRALDLDGGLVAFTIDSLTMGAANELVAFNGNVVRAENHVARSHFIDDGVEPIVE